MVFPPQRAILCFPFFALWVGVARRRKTKEKIARPRSLWGATLNGKETKGRPQDSVELPRYFMLSESQGRPKARTVGQKDNGGCCCLAFCPHCPPSIHSDKILWEVVGRSLRTRFMILPALLFPPFFWAVGREQEREDSLRLMKRKGRRRPSAIFFMPAPAQILLPSLCQPHKDNE